VFVSVEDIKIKIINQNLTKNTMDDQIIEQSALINEQQPIGMQMPEHMKERLAKRMELAKSKKD